MMLRNSERNELRRCLIGKTYVDIRAPPLELRMPFSKIACGENPVVEWDEVANDAPQNLVLEIPEARVTLFANSFHLRKQADFKSFSCIDVPQDLLPGVLRRIICLRPKTIIRVQVWFIPKFDRFQNYV